MSQYTHEFHEQGNGFPCVGDDVIVDCGHGDFKLQRVTGVSSIQTKQWAANWIYLTLTDADADWDDLEKEDQDRCFDSLHHVSEIDYSDLIDEISTAVEAADVCCPEQVSDACLAIAKNDGDWKAELARAKANDADERKALGVEAEEPTLQINEASLRDAVIEFIEKVDATQNHIHLRIGSDGLAYVSEDTSYCIGEDEFNKKPGHTITVKHQRGDGQCQLPEDWHEEDNGIDAIQDLIDAVLVDLSRNGHEVVRI
jgi:hypothetical protein